VAQAPEEPQGHDREQREPDRLVNVERIGADAFRTYMLFMGPFDQDNDFRDMNLVGVTRYVERVWRLVTEAAPVGGAGVEMRPLHQAIKRVTRELSAYQYHTAIAALMEFGNWIGANRDAFTAAQYALLSAFSAIGRVYVGPLAGYATDPQYLGLPWPVFFFLTFAAAFSIKVSFIGDWIPALYAEKERGKSNLPPPTMKYR